MARTRAGLTPATADKKKLPGLYLDAEGLYLRVSKTGAASWVFRYMLNGKAREMGLGSRDDVKIYEARDLAKTYRSLKARGIDPIDARKAERSAERVAAAKSVTFQACAEAYINQQRGEWKNPKHAAQWTSTLTTYAYPILGKLPVSEIDTGLVVKVLQPIWWVKKETARRLRGRIEAVLDWAKFSGYRAGDNPARWRGHLDQPFKRRSKVRKVKHHPALPYADMPGFFEALTAQEGTAAQALMFIIATLGRTGEVIGSKWPEVAMDACQWTISGDRMKEGKEHRVPLSPLAMKVLKHQFKATGGKGYIFPGQNWKKPLSNMAMLMLLERMGRDDITVHGFRSTFKDWASETTNFPDIVSEMALAHVVSDEVQAAYRRGDLFEKRKQLMNAWARHCTTPAQSGKVVPIVGRQSARLTKAS